MGPFYKAFLATAALVVLFPFVAISIIVGVPIIALVGTCRVTASAIIGEEELASRCAKNIC